MGDLICITLRFYVSRFRHIYILFVENHYICTASNDSLKNKKKNKKSVETRRWLKLNSIADNESKYR